MTKYRVVSIILMSILIAVVIILCALAQVAQSRKAAQQREIPTTLPQVDYVLGEYDGYLALFRGKQEQPYQILDMPVQLLSDYDRGQIAEGIHVQTEQELRQLVEDFAS